MEAVELRRGRTELPGRGLALETIEGGDGPPLLFLHGAAGSYLNWGYQLHDLARDHRVFAFNLRGHAGSPWPGPSSLEDFYEDVRAFLDAVPLGPRFVLLGHSFGGCLAARLAHRFPERVAGLGLFNTTGHLAPTLPARFFRLFARHSNWARRAFPGMISTPGEVSHHLMNHTLREWNVWGTYSQLRMPVLVALGGRDVLVPLKLGRQMAELIPDVRLEVVPDAGHVLMLERPRRVSAWIRELVARAKLERACDPTGSPDSALRAPSR